MRLRTLTIAAIGPFADEYTVDFDALSAGGLFLLEGPTGAGKSTIIDAIVFALYGKVASADASEDRLRSAYASDTVESFVDLTFEVAAGTFRVRRSPAYDRAKLRGTGTVRQQATVKLWRVAPDGDASELLATRLDEAGGEIQRAVGLDRTQFVQTIVLPQGEFARFLRAEPEDRRGLLQRIFGTEVYDRIGRRLVELRREADRAVDVARGALAGALARVVGAARLVDEDARAVAALADAAAGDLERDLGARVAAIEAEAERANRAALAAEAARAAARVELDEAVEVDRLVRLRAQLVAEAAALEARSEAIEADRSALAAARSAAAVRPLLAKVDEARAAAAAALKALAAALDAAPQPLRDLAPDGAALLAHRDATLGEAAAIERWVAVESELVASRHALRAARTGVEDLRVELAGHDAWLAARQGAREELSTALDAARSTARSIDARTTVVEGLEHVARQLVGLAAASAELAAARAAVPGLASTATEAVATEAALRQARLAGLAGELAGALSPGDACPVCGATSHPHKAVLGVDHVSQERVDAAQEERRRAEAALTAAGSDVARLAERVEGIQAQVGAATPESVAPQLATARDRLDEAQAAQRSAVTLAAALDAHDAETTARRSEREALALRIASDEARAEAMAQRLDADEVAVAAAAAEYPTVAARHATLRELATTAGDLAEALAASSTADGVSASRAVDLAEALADHGFADPSAARSATRDPSSIERLARSVAEFDAATAANRAARADPDIARLDPDAAVDLDAAREAERLARVEFERAAGAARVSQERAEAVAMAAGGTFAAASAVEQARRYAAPIARLAGLASGTGGDNAHDLTLATYVLQRRFEDVVAAANDRLVGMSDGRYELVRSESKEDVSSRRRGLAMQVVDHRTGQSRDPRTLSGGETFYVSLCLALGMADVVTAEAGGIELGTLFVDEGFGSLDAHTLDQVLTELARLRAGGRVVGVVSHVDALKQAIADRVEVRHLPGGASRLDVRAG